MKVEKWISYDEMDGMPEAPIGGMGGWFGWKGDPLKGEQRDVTTGMRWKDYLAAFNEAAHPYLEALRAEVLRLGLKAGGNWHQDHDEGVPVFSDGTVASWSYRGWGDLMAAIWSEAEDKDYNYMSFYMGWPDDFTEETKP